MNKYLLSVYQPDGPPPGPEILGKIMNEVSRLRDEMQAANVWISAGGLSPANAAKVVRVNNGQVLTTDGPYIESKEHLGGYTVIQAPNLETALEWASKTARATTLPIEVRQFQG